MQLSIDNKTYPPLFFHVSFFRGSLVFQRSLMSFPPPLNRRTDTRRLYFTALSQGTHAGASSQVHMEPYTSWNVVFVSCVVVRFDLMSAAIVFLARLLSSPSWRSCCVSLTFAACRWSWRAKRRLESLRSSLSRFIANAALALNDQSWDDRGPGRKADADREPMDSRYDPRYSIRPDVSLSRE